MLSRLLSADVHRDANISDLHYRPTAFALQQFHKNKLIIRELNFRHNISTYFFLDWLREWKHFQTKPMENQLLWFWATHTIVLFLSELVAVSTDEHKS